MSRIAIIDYEIGNLFSVQNMIESLGSSATITRDIEEIMASDAAVLPGVGAFGNAMRHLEAFKLVEIIREFIDTGRPFLGICLGLQLLFTESEEFGTTKGLGLINGTVRAFPRVSNGKTIKVPNTSWNSIEPGEIEWRGSILDGIDHGEFLYFVHSYYVVPEDSAMVLTKSIYEGFEYCSSVAKDNLIGTQFHPEKSGIAGRRIYQNFINMTENFKKSKR